MLFHFKIRHKVFNRYRIAIFDIVKKSLGAINEGVIVDWYMFSSQILGYPP